MKLKFGDKLIKLRKKRGLSQEDLASKLNVSRQSVSKWESNNTYPETDKIVQICSIFNCSMDDLINEEIEDIEQVERKEKNNLNVVLDSLLDFITKTINMLSSMKFLSIIKCIIEQIVLVLILVGIGALVCSFIPTVICHVMTFLPSGVYHKFFSLIRGVCEILWLIVSVISIIHIFKIRYLNYYDEYKNEEQSDKNIIDSSNNGDVVSEKSNSKTSSKEKISFEEKRRKDSKIVFRDPNHEPFAFLSILSKIVIFTIKMMVSFVGLFFVFTLILAVTGLVISIYLSFSSMLFVGASLSFAGAVIFNIILILILLYFIINKKVNVKVMVIICFISFMVMGIGLGIGIISIKNFRVIDDNERVKNIKEKNIELVYNERMVISTMHTYNYEFIIDSSMIDNKIIVKGYYDRDFSKVRYQKDYDYGMENYWFYLSSSDNFSVIFNTLIDDLKNNTIRDYSFDSNDPEIKIVANEATVLKLIDNLSKVYLFSQTKTEEGYFISNVSNRIVEENSECLGEYDAKNNTLTCPKWCLGNLEEVNTDKGSKVYYSCKYKEDY